MYSLPTPVSVLGATLTAAPIAFTGSPSLTYATVGAAMVVVGLLFRRAGKCRPRTFDRGGQ